MYDFILSCCGTLKSADIFQQARLACVQVNWQAPPEEPFSKLISIITGHDQQYDAEIAYNNLLAHLEQDQQRKNASFVLKNLVILDFIVEERAFLNRMGRYNNNELIFAEGEGKANKLALSMRELIASYYIYIKQKAKYYEVQSKELVKAEGREQFLSKQNSVTMLNEINICFKIQNLILDINSKYKNGDKSSELIQFIFSLLLKTYIFCHSIVSITLKVFVSRLFSLSRYDLEYIKKFSIYFNKEYTKNLVNFIVINQAIPSFQDFPYKEIILNDQQMIKIIETQLNNIQGDPGICPEPQELTQQSLKLLSNQMKNQQVKTHETSPKKSQSGKTPIQVKEVQVKKSQLKQEQIKQQQTKESEVKKQQLKKQQVGQVKQQQEKEQQAENQQVKGQQGKKRRFYNKVYSEEHLGGVQKEGFEKYENFYSTMWPTQTTYSEASDGGSQLMTPRQIYAYYGVPLEESEQQSSEEEDEQEEEDVDEDEEQSNEKQEGMEQTG